MKKHKWVGEHCRASVSPPNNLGHVLCDCKKCLAYTGGEALAVIPKCSKCDTYVFDVYCGEVEFECRSCAGKWKTDVRPTGCIFPMCRAPNCDLIPKP